MSPLQIALLLRAYCMPRPNQELPESQAYAPSMINAITEFRDNGLFHCGVTSDTLRQGVTGSGLLLTDKGEALAQRIMDAASKFYKECA